MKNNNAKPQIMDLASKARIALSEVRTHFAKNDPACQLDGLRINTVYAIHRATNPALLSPDPVDIGLIVDRLGAISTFIRAQKQVAAPLAAQPAHAISLAESLDYTAKLYGRAWKVFSPTQYMVNASLLARRFAANGLDPHRLIADRDCLDFGCGTGRNSLAMAMLGAKSVHGVDASKGVLEEAKLRTAPFPESARIRFEQGNLYEKLAGQSGLYDFVVAQGVIHHMSDPKRAISIIHELLRPQGQFFIYVFGHTPDGVYWEIIDTYRDLLKDVPQEQTQALLTLLDASAPDIFNILDFSYVPIQFRFAPKELEGWFAELGFSRIEALVRGEVYDSHFRTHLYPWEMDFWGQFDLRYLLTK